MKIKELQWYLCLKISVQGLYHIIQRNHTGTLSVPSRNWNYDSCETHGFILYLFFSQIIFIQRIFYKGFKIYKNIQEIVKARNYKGIKGQQKDI